MQTYTYENAEYAVCKVYKYENLPNASMQVCKRANDYLDKKVCKCQSTQIRKLL